MEQYTKAKYYRTVKQMSLSAPLPPSASPSLRGGIIVLYICETDAEEIPQTQTNTEFI